MIKTKVTALLLALAGIAGVRAGSPALTAPSGKLDGAVQPTEKEKSIYDKIWGVTKLYHNDQNSFIQDLSITGRFQVDWYSFNANQGSSDDWIIRRTRIGLKAKVLQNFTIHAEVSLDPQNPDPFYTKLTDTYISWSPAKEFKLTVGKQPAKFTLDGGTSSTQLITIDRSSIAQNFWFPEEYIPGVTVSGELGKWTYNVGYFSSGEASPEFGDFNAGSFGLVSVGYNLAEAVHADKALLRADFIYQDEDPNNAKGTPSPFTRNSEMVGSLNFQMEKGRFGLGTDLAATKGYLGQPNLFGLQFMPSYYLTADKKLQAVFRYTYVGSDGPRGIRFGRYENAIVSGRCNEYNEFYAGLNWYLYGHKFKIQSGVQYTTANDSTHSGGDYDGWGATVGARWSW